MESKDLDAELGRIKEALLQATQRMQNAPAAGEGIMAFHSLTEELMMGSPVVKEAVEREVRRIAMAFGAPEVATFDAHPARDGGLVLRLAMFEPECVNVVKQPDMLSITVGAGRGALRFGQGTAKTIASGGDPASRSALHRALFKLGYEGQLIDQALGCSLSNHEKMEIRLNFPREFWPKKWLEEEKAAKGRAET